MKKEYILSDTPLNRSIAAIMSAITGIAILATLCSKGKSTMTDEQLRALITGMLVSTRSHKPSELTDAIFVADAIIRETKIVPVIPLPPKKPVAKKRGRKPKK